MLNFIKKAISTLDRRGRFGQCQTMKMTINYDAIHPYGFVSKTKKGSLVLVLSPNRDNSNVLGIEYDNKLSALMSELLEPGESAIYHPEKMSYIIFKNSGKIKILGINDIDIDAAGLNITAETVHVGNMSITGNLLVSGNISAGGNVLATGTVSATAVAASGAISGASLSAAGKDFTSHIHSGVTIGGDVTGPIV